MDKFDNKKLKDTFPYRTQKTIAVISWPERGDVLGDIRFLLEKGGDGGVCVWRGEHGLSLLRELFPKIHFKTRLPSTSEKVDLFIYHAERPHARGFRDVNRVLHEEMKKQMKFHQAHVRGWSNIQFSLPYVDGSVEVDERYLDYEYLSGDLRLTPWNTFGNTCRLWVPAGAGEVVYDADSFDRKMNFWNSYLRPIKVRDRRIPEGMPSTWDALYEVTVATDLGMKVDDFERKLNKAVGMTWKKFFAERFG